MTGNCANCGQAFRRRGTKAARFCSRTCFLAKCKPPVTKQCEQCGASFTVKGAIADRSHFCSRACYWASGGPAKNSPFVQAKAENGEVQGDYKQTYIGRQDGRPAYMRRSHAVWNASHPEDPVKPGEHIHHIDHNRTNDVPENLTKLPAEQHLRHHGLLISRDEISKRLKAYHAANPGKQRQGQAKTCPVCGSEFYRPPSAKAVTCSYECMGKRTSQERRKERVS